MIWHCDWTPPTVHCHCTLSLRTAHCTYTVAVTQALRTVHCHWTLSLHVAVTARPGRRPASNV